MTTPTLSRRTPPVPAENSKMSSDRLGGRNRRPLYAGYGRVEMERNRRPEDSASGKADSALLLRGRWVTSMLMVALVMVAACGGDGDQSGSPLDDDAADQAPVETTSDGSTGDEGAGDEASGDESATGAEPGTEVEGAFAFAVDFRAGEIWAINPDTQSIGLINTIDSETQRLWITGGDLWLASSTEVLHVDTSGEQLGSIELEGVYNLVADDGEVWVSGGPSSARPYLSKLEAASHSEVASIATQELTGEFGQFEGLALGGDTIWLSYTIASGRASEIDRMDRDSLEVVGTTTVPIEARRLVWDGTSLWAAGWRADSNSFGVVQIAADGAVMSEFEISEFEKSRGWDFAVTDDGVWLANLGSSELIRLDPASNSETARIQFGGFGLLEGIHVSDGRLWASVHQGESSYIELTLYVIDRESNEATAVMELPERLRASFLPDDD